MYILGQNSFDCRDPGWLLLGTYHIGAVELIPGKTSIGQLDYEGNICLTVFMR